MPTILDLAGAEIPEGLDGVSLAGAVRGEPVQTREHVYGTCNGQHTNHFIVEGDWKYIWFPATNEEQLFNLRDDPQELHDRSGESDRIDGLRARMAEEVAEIGDVEYDTQALLPCANRTPKVFWS